MNRNKNTQAMGAYAPQKNRLFSISTTTGDVRIRIVNNAPQLEQAIRRTRAD